MIELAPPGGWNNVNEGDSSWPAFPQHPEQGNMQLWRHGMSLRDYFAGQALTEAFQNGDTEIHDDVMARRCYEIADAMLKARVKEQS